VNNAFIVDERSDGRIASQQEANPGGRSCLSSRTTASYSSPKVAFDPPFRSPVAARQPKEQSGSEYSKLPKLLGNAVCRFDGALAIFGRPSHAIGHAATSGALRLAKVWEHHLSRAESRGH
jgi:hypothetical protein